MEKASNFQSEQEMLAKWKAPALQTGGVELVVVSLHNENQDNLS